MSILPAYWAYIDKNRDGVWETVRLPKNGHSLTIFQVRKLSRQAVENGWGFRSKRIPVKKKVKKTAPKLTPLNYAKQELGTTEYPPGSNVVRYSKWYGLTGPWCAEFVSWCADQAGIDGIHYAYVPYIVDDARNNRNGLSVTKHPRPGDIACYDWDGGVADHVGFVEKVYADGSFDAIEGNTSVGNDSNGGEVMRRRRYPSQVEAFVTHKGLRDGS